MRTQICKALLGVLSLLLAVVITTQPASAQQVVAITCAESASITYTNGLRATPSTQTLKASANLTACANLTQLLGAVPTNLSWQGTAYEVQCTSPTGNSADPGTGIVTWDDNQDPSSIELVSFTNSNLDGGAVTLATFRVTAGRLAGTTFTAENAFVPALNQLNCSDQNPEYEIQGEGIGEDILGLL
ncbi:hypothetical protein [Dyella sp.]|uniref:hypothetical protein n=1 Tax=Dyella sp. TaxID=1869338 RepID=UPI002D77B196|nr:hypothetical protein [Dyella sp.]HET7330341.1 hypothetical protein [Dyella sp.]